MASPLRLFDALHESKGLCPWAPSASICEADLHKHQNRTSVISMARSIGLGIQKLRQFETSWQSTVRPDKSLGLT